MPEVLDWQQVADLPATIRQAVRALRAGQLVVFPTETTPCLAASALAPAATARLRHQQGKDQPLAVAVRGMAEGRDWVPGMSSLAQRLARRFWPGPLTLAFRSGLAHGLLGRIPEPVRQQVCPADALWLRSPGHDAVLEVLRHLKGPLLLAGLPAGTPAEECGADLVLDDDAGPYPEGPTVVEVLDHSWNLRQAGAISEEMLRRQSICMVLFVCTGNTCRSPLAEALCKRLLSRRLGCAVEELPQHGFYVLSAGLAAMTGARAADEALAVAAEHGADLAGHRSRPLTPELAAQADYLVTMTRGHLQALNNHFPRLGSRPRLLCPQGDDIADPIGQDQQVYQACGRQIDQYLETLVAELVPDTQQETAAT
jgi:protein-tyrosine phosphatase